MYRKQHSRELVILAFDDVEYKREMDESTGYGELSIKNSQ
jgi:hypothetical protein